VTDQFVIDIASYQEGYSVATSTAAAIFAKVTEGTYYVNPFYAGWQGQAKAANKLLAWYHFLSGENAQAQAAFTKAHIDPSLVGMLDIEPEKAYKPTLAEAFAYIDACKAEGLTVRFAYLPHWYWVEMGRPDLSGFAARGVHLISSAYPAGSGSAEGIYAAAGGDNGEGWAGYGNATPVLWQFTNQATDQGMRVDYSAFKGSAAELGVLFGKTAPVPPHANAAVVALQKLLNAHGAGLAEDGIKGPLTNGAIRAHLSGLLVEQGQTGLAVQVLQATLNVFGAGLAVDGVFGPKTALALKDFQAAHALKADAICGPKTLAVLAP